MGRFKVGDTVLVAYPPKCCGVEPYLGKVFTINSKDNFWYGMCRNCKFHIHPQNGDLVLYYMANVDRGGFTEEQLVKQPGNKEVSEFDKEMESADEQRRAEMLVV